MSTSHPEDLRVLNKLKSYSPRRGPLVLAIMDGVAFGPQDDGNAVTQAYKPTLDWLLANYPTIQLKAHGLAVGLPTDDDMGNSEVGHNALGAGRIFDQGAKLVDRAIASGKLFEGPLWQEVIKRGQSGKTVHLLGLVSDGNVHSHINQVYALIQNAHSQGVRRLRVHALLDGRDVEPASALSYIAPLEEKLALINNEHDRDYRIASGGGRMVVTMDRYETDWGIVERGWKAHVLGQGRQFHSTTEAIETYYSEMGAAGKELQDQFMGEFVIVNEQSAPVGAVNDGDAVIFFNFRGDRAIELSKAFDYEDFPYFDRQRRPEVFYAGIMQYDGDEQIPRQYLVAPSAIDYSISELLAANGVTQYACTEGVKFGHLTLFWNGNRSGYFNEKIETYINIPSDPQEKLAQRPWMKAAEITDKVVEAIESNNYRFIRLNYANGDMVGHTGDLAAAITAMGTVDLCLQRLAHAVQRAQGILVVVADHGNADEMYQHDKKSGGFKRDKDGNIIPKVSHTTNPVPFVIYDPSGNESIAINSQVTEPGLANVAATLLNLLGYEAPNGEQLRYEPSLIKVG